MEKKVIYTVMRIEESEINGRKKQSLHTYTFQTSNLVRVHEYARKIKKSYPWAKIAVIDRDKAKEIERKQFEFYKAQHEKRMARYKERSKELLIRQVVYSECLKNK